VTWLKRRARRFSCAAWFAPQIFASGQAAAIDGACGAT
jgi:hypothetical protein